MNRTGFYSSSDALTYRCRRDKISVWSSQLETEQICAFACVHVQREQLRSNNVNMPVLSLHNHPSLSILTAKLTAHATPEASQYRHHQTHQINSSNAPDDDEHIGTNYYL